MRKADYASYEELITALKLYVCETSKHCETLVAASQCLIDVLEDDPKACEMNSILQRCAREIFARLETIKAIQSSLEMDRFVVTPPQHHFEW